MDKFLKQINPNFQVQEQNSEVISSHSESSQRVTGQKRIFNQMVVVSEDQYSFEDWHKRRVREMDPELKSYYDLTEALYIEYSKKVYDQNPAQYPHDVVLSDERNTALHIQGWKKAKGEFNFNAKAKPFYYDKDAKTLHWNVLKDLKPLIDKWRVQVGTWKQVSQVKCGLVQTSKKLNQFQKAVSTINRSKKSESKNALRTAAKKQLHQFQDGKIGLFSAKALLDMNLTSIQQNSELKDGVKRDAYEEALIMTKKFRTIFLCLTNDQQAQNHHISEEPLRYCRYAQAMIHKSRNRGSWGDQTFLDLVRSGNGALRTERELTTDQIDQLHVKLEITDLVLNDYQWVDRIQTPPWADNKKWDFFTKDRGNKSTMKKYYAYHLKRFMRDIGIWEIRGTSGDNEEKTLKSLKGRDWKSQVWCKTSKVFKELVDWSKIYDEDKIRICGECNQLSQYVNITTRKSEKLNHCVKENNTPPMSASTMVNDAIAYCVPCDMVIGTDDNAFFANSMHQCSMHLKLDEFHDNFKVSGLAYQRVNEFCIRQGTIHDDESSKVVTLREAQMLAKLAQKTMVDYEPELIPRHQDLRRLADNSDIFVPAKVFFHNPSKDFEVTQSPWLADGRALNYRQDYLDKLDQMEKFENLIKNAKKYCYATNGQSIDCVIAEMAIWCFDNKELACSVHLKKAGDSWAHLLSGPIPRATCIDFVWRLLGDFCEVMWVLGNQYGYCLKYVDFDMIFVNLDEAKAKFSKNIFADTGNVYQIKAGVNNKIPMAAKYNHPIHTKKACEPKIHYRQTIIKILLTWQEWTSAMNEDQAQRFFEPRQGDKAWIYEIQEENGLEWRKIIPSVQNFAKADKMLSNDNWEFKDLKPLLLHGKPGSECCQFAPEKSVIPVGYMSTDIQVASNNNMTLDQFNSTYGLDTLVDIPRNIHDKSVARAQKASMIRMLGMKAIECSYDSFSDAKLTALFLKRMYSLSMQPCPNPDQVNRREQALLVGLLLRVAMDPVLKNIAPPGDESNRVQYFMFFANEFVKTYEITNRNYFQFQNELALIIDKCDWIDNNTLTAIIDNMIPHTNQKEPFVHDEIEDKESALGALSSFKFGEHAMKLEEALGLVVEDKTETVKINDKLTTFKMSKKLEHMKNIKEKIQKSGDASANNEKVALECDYETFKSWLDQDKINNFQGQNLFTVIATQGSIGNTLTELPIADEAIKVLYDMALNKDEQWPDLNIDDEAVNALLKKHQEQLKELVDKEKRFMNNLQGVIEDTNEHFLEASKLSKLEYSLQKFAVHGLVRDQGQQIIHYVKVKDGRVIPVLAKQIMINLYHALGFPGPMKEGDWKTSNVKDSDVNKFEDFHDVKTTHSHIREFAIDDPNVYPILYYFFCNSFSLTGPVFKSANHSMKVMSMERLRSLWLNSWYYYLGTWDPNSYDNCTIRMLIIYQVQALKLPEVTIAWRAKKYVCAEDAYYSPYWPDELFMKVKNPFVKNEIPFDPNTAPKLTHFKTSKFAKTDDGDDNQFKTKLDALQYPGQANFQEEQNQITEVPQILRHEQNVFAYQVDGDIDFQVNKISDFVKCWDIYDKMQKLLIADQKKQRMLFNKGIRKQFKEDLTPATFGGLIENSKNNQNFDMGDDDEMNHFDFDMNTFHANNQNQYDPQEEIRILANKNLLPGDRVWRVNNMIKWLSNNQDSKWAKQVIKHLQAHHGDRLQEFQQYI